MCAQLGRMSFKLVSGSALRSRPHVGPTWAVNFMVGSEVGILVDLNVPPTSKCHNGKVG